MEPKQQKRNLELADIFDQAAAAFAKTADKIRDYSINGDDARPLHLELEAMRRAIAATNKAADQFILENPINGD